MGDQYVSLPVSNHVIGEIELKIIINKCFGGFRLSEEAYEWLIKNKNWEVTSFYKDGYKNPKAQLVRNPDYKPGSTINHKYYSVLDEDRLRVNPHVIECLEKLGSEKASSPLSKLKIIEIPDNIEWVIDEYDGVESVSEKHEVWS